MVSSSHIFLGLPCLLVPGTISIRMCLGRRMMFILKTWPNQDSCDSVMRARILLGSGIDRHADFICVCPNGWKGKTCNSRKYTKSISTFSSYLYIFFLWNPIRNVMSLNLGNLYKGSSSRSQKWWLWFFAMSKTYPWLLKWNQVNYDIIVFI